MLNKHLQRCSVRYRQLQFIIECLCTLVTFKGLNLSTHRMSLGSSSSAKNTPAEAAFRPFAKPLYKAADPPSLLLHIPRMLPTTTDPTHNFPSNLIKVRTSSKPFPLKVITDFIQVLSSSPSFIKFHHHGPSSMSFINVHHQDPFLIKVFHQGPPSPIEVFHQGK
jgi:hypothetical protein